MFINKKKTKGKKSRDTVPLTTVVNNSCTYSSALAISQIHPETGSFFNIPQEILSFFWEDLTCKLGPRR
jgi:hypothetical protein